MLYSRVLYIGAGLDMTPLQYMYHVKDFVYVDSRPYSEYGLSIYLDKNGQNTSYDSFFLFRLEQLMKKHNMSKCYKKDNKHVYSDGERTLTYYVNTSIPEHIPVIKHELKNTDAIIVSGHDPHYEIMNHFEEPIHFIGVEGTCYTPDETSDGDELCHNLNRNRLYDKFKSFDFMYTKDSLGMHIESYNTWGEFIGECSFL